MNLEKFNTYTDAELNEVINAIAEIQRKRRAEKKIQLVAKFKEAYFALKDAGITIYHDEIGIWTFDEFEFD